ncbi:BrnT family toxin [Duganella radicis]|uniref:BrnT family toxin n=1 Tax=Duganella radicis TaxID=551988 RepID=A0A6L6PMI9_9BURK|nr:BrnT family toxin [Duganella radicis]MTV39939.1 BrnT family toxin [Duganella radicis]
MTIYTWDETKRKANLRLHGLDFADAHSVLEWSQVTYEDTRYHYNERRFITLGYFQGFEVSIAHTEDNYGIRIISFRKASRWEKRILHTAQ